MARRIADIEIKLHRIIQFNRHRALDLPPQQRSDAPQKPAAAPLAPDP